MTKSLTERVETATQQVEDAGEVYSEVKCADSNTMVDTTCGMVPSLRKVLKDLGGYQYKGEWAANTEYEAKDQVKDVDGVIWLCIENHTSGSDFQVDSSAGKWLAWQVINDTPVFNRRVIDFGIGVAFGPYDEDGRTLLPRLRIGAVEYVSVSEITGNLTFTAADIEDRFDGSAVIQTSAGEKVFSKIEAEAVDRKTAVVKDEFNSIPFLTSGSALRTLDDRFSDVASIMDFGVVGGGVTDNTIAIQAAIDSGKVIDFTNSGKLKLSSTLTAPNGFTFICSDRSEIIGFDGLGILSGGSVIIEGLTVRDFYDGTDKNKYNISTGFCRIDSGSVVGKVTLYNVRAFNCRSVVFSGNTSNEFDADVTIKTEVLRVVNSRFSGCSSAINWRALVTKSECLNNIFINTVGAGRIVVGYAAYVDGIAQDSPYYKQIQNHVVKDNYFNTVVNRTITGDSTVGNSYEAHAIMLSGRGAVISGNTIIDCTGNRYDSEGIYTKCTYARITDNFLFNGGSGEGAILLKGVPPDYNPPDPHTSPYGDTSIVANNIVEFTRSRYLNGTNEVDLTDVLIGIRCTAPHFLKVHDNIIRKSNMADIILDGGIGSQNRDASILSNSSDMPDGKFSIYTRGAFRQLRIEGNTTIEPSLPENIERFSMIYLESTPGRGKWFDSVNINGNLVKSTMDNGRFDGKPFSLFTFDSTDFKCYGLYIRGNIWDVSKGTATPDLRPFYETRRSETIEGDILKFVCEGNVFTKALDIYPLLATLPFKDATISFKYVANYKCPVNSFAVVTSVALAADSVMTLDYTYDALVSSQREGHRCFDKGIINFFTSSSTTIEVAHKHEIVKYNNVLNYVSEGSTHGISGRLKITAKNVADFKAILDTTYTISSVVAAVTSLDENIDSND